jgi:hypothetical protein
MGGIVDPTTSSTGGGSNQPAEVFAEGPNTLYKLDPTTKAFTKVGDFVGLSQADEQGGVIDIAVDKDGQMYGTTYTALWLIDKTNARCTKIADGTYPNSLSLVPAGTVDPSDEALVGYVNADYVRIDKTSGAVTTIGKLSSLGDRGRDLPHRQRQRLRRLHRRGRSEDRRAQDHDRAPRAEERVRPRLLGRLCLRVRQGWRALPDQPQQRGDDAHSARRDLGGVVLRRGLDDVGAGEAAEVIGASRRRGRSLQIALRFELERGSS